MGSEVIIASGGIICSGGNIVSKFFKNKKFLNLVLEVQCQGDKPGYKARKFFGGGIGKEFKISPENEKKLSIFKRF